MLGSQYYRTEKLKILQVRDTKSPKTILYMQACRKKKKNLKQKKALALHGSHGELFYSRSVNE